MQSIPYQNEARGRRYIRAGITVVSPAAIMIFNRFLHFAFGFGRNDHRMREWNMGRWYAGHTWKNKERKGL